MSKKSSCGCLLQHSLRIAINKHYWPLKTKWRLPSAQAESCFIQRIRKWERDNQHIRWLSLIFVHQEFRALEPHVEAISRRIAVNISEFSRKISESFRKKSENFSHFSDFLVGSVAHMLQNRDLVGLTFKRLFVPKQIYWIVEQIIYCWLDGVVGYVKNERQDTYKTMKDERQLSSP